MNMAYIENLKKILNRYKVSGSNVDTFTHTGMTPYIYGKYLDNNLGFVKSITQILEDNFIKWQTEEGGTSIGVVAMNLDVAQLIVDVDIYLNNDIDKSTFDGMKLEILHNLNKILLNDINFDKSSANIENTDLYSFILYRNQYYTPYTKEGSSYKYKTGIHIHYPFLYLDAEDRFLIHYRLLESLERSNFIEKYKIANRLTDVIDTKIINTSGFMLYGCSKEGKSPYVLQEIYNTDLEEMDISEYTFSDLIELLNPRRWELFTDDDKKVFRKHIKNEWDEEKRNVYKTRYNHTSFTRRTNKNINKKNSVDVHELTSKKIEEIRLTTLYVNLWNDERACDYIKWRNALMALKNIHPTELKEVARQFSMRCPGKFDDAQFEKFWNNLKYDADGFKFPSVELWATHDNYHEYIKLKESEFYKTIITAISGTTHDIAVAMYQIYGKFFVCSDISKHIWWEYRNGKWIKIQEGCTLMMKISDDLSEIYIQQSKNLWIQIADLPKEKDTERKELMNKAAKIQELIPKLKDITFKLKIMTECRTIFHVSDFESKLNENKKIMVYKNGVLDLDTMEFREGMPEDYMSFCTNCNYIEYDENDPMIQKVYHVIRSIHPNEELMKYFLTTLATGLHGLKKQQQFLFWQGKGSNGKSFTIDWIQKTYGDYVEIPSITLLTRKRQTSANASPDIIKLKGKRWLIFLEPEVDDTIHTSLMKQLFGADYLEGRQMYSSEYIRFQPQGMGIISCNDPPVINAQDYGTWRRIRMLKFGIKFTENPKEPNERLVDPSLSQELNDMLDAFNSVLIHYYVKYVWKSNSIYEPEEVTDHTKRYHEDNDIFQEFFTAFIRVSDEDSLLKLDEVYDVFKAWSKDTKPGNRLPPRKELQTRIENKWWDMYNRSYWKGLSLINDYDTIDTFKQTKMSSSLDI